MANHDAMAFSGLAGLLEVTPPARGETVVVLSEAQALKLKEQFAPFMASASAILNRQMGGDTPVSDLLKPDIFDSLQTNLSGQHGGDFVLLSETCSDGSGRAIVWFKGEDRFLVSRTFEQPDGSGGSKYQVEIPFDDSNINIRIPQRN